MSCRCDACVRACEPLGRLAGEIGKAVIADTLLADIGQLISVLGALPARQAATLTAVMLYRAIRITQTRQQRLLGTRARLL